MFGVSPMKDGSEGPYSDYRHLELQGKLLRPVAVKASRVELASVAISRAAPFFGSVSVGD